MTTHGVPEALHFPLQDLHVAADSCSTSDASIIFTHRAATKVWELIEEEQNFNLKLRVYVTGGGCSGFQYGFSFDEIVQPDDTVIVKTLTDRMLADQTHPAVSLLVDALSFQYLVGAEIDYKQDIEGERFIIRNPNAKTTCGCGSSFSA